MQPVWQITNDLIQTLKHFEIIVNEISLSTKDDDKKHAYGKYYDSFGTLIGLNVYFNKQEIIRAWDDNFTSDFYDQLRQIKVMTISEIDKNIELGIHPSIIANKIFEVLESINNFDLQFSTHEILIDNQPNELIYSDRITFDEQQTDSFFIFIHNTINHLQLVTREYYREFKGKYSKYISVHKRTFSDNYSFRLNRSNKFSGRIPKLFELLEQSNFMNKIDEDSFIKVFQHRTISKKVVWTDDKDKLKFFINELFEREIILSGKKLKWKITVYCFDYFNDKKNIIEELQVKHLRHAHDPKDKTLLTEIIKSAFKDLKLRST